MEENDKKKGKVLFLFLLIIFGLIIFLTTLFYWTTIDRRLPRLQVSDGNTALRGSILSADKYTIATSKKLYKVMVDTRNIDKNKLDLFVNLYCIYSGDKPKRVKKLILSNRANIILSYKIDAKRAKYLQDLSRKLYKMRVFISYIDKRSGNAILRGMSVVESGEDRLYVNGTVLSPVVGYVQKIEKGEITKIIGVKGIERYYEDKLSPIQDALIVGPKDIGNNVILNRNSLVKKRIDGYSVVLSISMKLQKSIEDILDKQKMALNAKEILAVVMKSDTGEILALASSNRFNPNNITRKDYKSLNPSVSEFAYEPGSVMKPIILSLLLREDKINPYDLVNTHNGRYKLAGSIIRDSHPFKFLSAEDVIVYSSNVGMIQLAEKLDPIEYYQGLRDFGFAQKTQVDLPYEHSGYIPSPKKFQNSVYRATVGYGYGLQTTFIQLMQAFNVFNNKGRLVKPHMGVALIGDNGTKYAIAKPTQKQVLPMSIAKKMKRILIKTVKEGTGESADVQGLEIGGKTGTAHIAKDGRYEDIYNGSFIGFANDDKNRYVIGILAREPKKRGSYYGAKSAAPVFKKITEAMILENFLVQNAQ